jgi:hypothetical protein
MAASPAKGHEKRHGLLSPHNNNVIRETHQRIVPTAYGVIARDRRNY